MKIQESELILHHFMRYSTKLFFLFFSFVFLSLVIFDTAFYLYARSLMFMQGVQQIESILRTSVALINFDGIEEIRSEEDRQKQVYTRIQDALEKIIHENQSEGIQVTYAYTLRPLPNRPGYLEYIVDGDRSKNRELVGKVTSNQKQEDLLQHLTHVYIPKKFVKTKWGDLITGYAPILDVNGRYVATLGIDVYHEDIFKNLEKVLMFQGIVSLAYIILGAGGAWLIAFWLAKPIKQVAEATERMSHEEQVEPLEIKGKDELHYLARSLNEISNDLMEKKILVRNFSKILTRQLVEKRSKEGYEREATLLYMDIKNIARLGAQMTPTNFQFLLNRYFEALLKAIYRYGGMIDKITRDQLWVLFGVSKGSELKEFCALQAAQEMREALDELNMHRYNSSEIPIRLGMGIMNISLVVDRVTNDECYIPYQPLEEAAMIAQRATLVAPSILVSEDIYKRLTHQEEFEKIEGDFGNKPLYAPKNNT